MNTVKPNLNHNKKLYNFTGRPRDGVPAIPAVCGEEARAQAREHEIDHLDLVLVPGFVPGRQDGFALRKQQFGIRLVLPVVGHSAPPDDKLHHEPQKYNSLLR